jgi:hypothetical protein
MTASSVAHRAPGLRWSIEGLPTPDWIALKYAEQLPFELTPVIANGRVIVRSRLDEAWAAFDLKTGSVLVRARLPTPVERCSAPGVAPDGRIAVVVFRSLAAGLSLEEYDADGTHRRSWPLPFSYAKDEGPTPADMGLPDHPPGPGSIVAPTAGPNGSWIVCAEEWVNNDAPWATAALRAEPPEVVWTRPERMLAATADVGIFFERAAIVGVDLATGATRWRIATASIHGKFTWASADRVVVQDPGGRLAIFSVTGERIAIGTSSEPIVAFGGAWLFAVVARSRTVKACPVTDLGAWAWALDVPLAVRGRDLGIAAEHGWVALCDRTTGTLSVYGPDPEGLPGALIGARFVSEDGRLACRIDRGEGADEEGAFRTTVWASEGEPVLLEPVVTRWRPAADPSSADPGERLGRIEAELGVVGAGNLYRLYVARANPDPAIHGEKRWITALADTPLHELRLFPEYVQSPYMPDDGDWQSGWWYPYSTFRPA